MFHYKSHFNAMDTLMHCEAHLKVISPVLATSRFRRRPVSSATIERAAVNVAVQARTRTSAGQIQVA